LINRFTSTLDKIGVNVDKDLLASLYNNLDTHIKKNAKVILLPVATASGVVYGMDNKTGKPVPFSFSRDSSATLFDKDKNMRLVGADMPRVDYGNYSGGVKLLIEKESTNYVRDNDFNLKLDIVGTNYQIIDYDWDSVVLATKAAQLSSGLGATSYYYKRPGNIPNTDVTASMFYQNSENQQWINGVAAGYDGLINFSDFQSTTPFINTIIKDGIYRISRDGYTLNLNPFYGFAKQTGTLSRKSYVIGYQVEDGDTVTSYIPTTDSQATRSADSLSIELQNESSVYLKTTSQETTLQKPAGIWNIHEDLNNEGIEILAIL